MLTDAAIRRLKPKDKPYKRADSGGLYLLVTATARLWRVKYRLRDTEQLLSIGSYPAVSLADARAARDQAKAHLKAGRDPAQEKKLRRPGPAGVDFETIAREWHRVHAPTWSERHAKDVIDSLETFVFPEIGSKGINDIDAAEMLRVLRLIEARPAVETARRVRQRCSAVFVFAIAEGKGRTDPAAMVQKALIPVHRQKQPAVTDLDEVREMLRKVEAIPAHPRTRLAMRFIALTVVRPGEIRGAAWKEMPAPGVETPIWKIPAARMKGRLLTKREHWVPLSRQAVDIVTVLRTLTRRPEGETLVFPSRLSVLHPMSENALGYLLNRAGYFEKHVAHGWRSTFSTIMNERFHLESRIIDMMLAHVNKDKVEAAYNRAAFIQRRAELAQIWADILLDGFPPAAELLKLPKR